ncbi:MAG: hypothetical protein ABH803_02655 [Candidatus Micrarchaeota archaeon]
MLVVILSSKPFLLKECLTAYSKQSKNDSFLVISPKTCFTENTRLTKEIDCDCELVCEEDFIASVNEFSFLFSGFGGLRNIGLLHAVKKELDCVFFDDDTLPVNDCLASYRELFKQGKEIICGKYLGHSAGSTGLLLLVLSVLENYLKQKTSKQETEKKLFLLLKGIPEYSKEVFASSGLVGGNMGVSLKVAKNYCFFPSKYRVEDGSFGFLAPHYDFQVFNPQGSDASLLPVVKHEKQPVERAFVNNLLSEAKGSVVSLCVDAKLKDVKLESSDCAEQVYRGFLLDYFKEKISKFNALDLNENILKDLDELRVLTPQDLISSDFDSAFNSFFNAQALWKKALETIS